MHKYLNLRRGISSIIKYISSKLNWFQMSFYQDFKLMCFWTMCSKQLMCVYTVCLDEPAVIRHSTCGEMQLPVTATHHCSQSALLLFVIRSFHPPPSSPLISSGFLSRKPCPVCWNKAVCVWRPVGGKAWDWQSAGEPEPTGRSHRSEDCK